MTIEYQTSKEFAFEAIRTIAIILGLLVIFFVLFFSFISGHFIVLDWLSPSDSLGSVGAPTMTTQPNPIDDCDYAKGRHMCHQFSRIADALEKEN